MKTASNKTPLAKLLLLALCMAATAGKASPAQPDVPPTAVREEGMKPLARVRELMVPALREIPGSMTCRVNYLDRYFGYLTQQEYRLRHKMRLQSTCFDAKKVEWLHETPVRFDPEREEWLPDIERYLQWAATATGQNELEPGYKKLRRDALRTYHLKSVNAQGFAFTEEDVIGEEKSRTRYLDYCLFHGEVALCGRGNMGYVAEGSKGDLTDYVLQILRSIEFLPNLPSAPSAAASGASAAGR